jgi:hypothetical protein
MPKGCSHFLSRKAFPRGQLKAGKQIIEKGLKSISTPPGQSEFILTNSPARFFLFPSDIFRASRFCAEGSPAKVEPALPTLRPGQFQALFFENVESGYTNQIEP